MLPKSFFLLFLTLIFFLWLNNNRVVNDIHGFSTKKNKEYQEKLPLVVLRVVEIIYSKANSEVTFLLCFLLTCLCTQLFYFMVCKTKKENKNDLRLFYFLRLK